MSEIKARVVLDRNLLACTDPDDTRYAIGAVLVEPPSTAAGLPRLVATDGKRLVVAEADGEAAAPAIIPREAFGGKGDSTFIRVAELTNQWKIELQSVRKKKTIGSQVKRWEVHPLVEGRFPQWRAIVPNYDNDCHIISIDAKLLYEIALAIGALDCRIRIIVSNSGGAEQPIGVMADHQKTRAFGVLSPLRIDDPSTCLRDFRELVAHLKK